MAFLYADPIVKVGDNGSIIAVDTPLNLEMEYDRVVSSLKKTGKEFKIKKEAINSKSLQQILQLKPKIIHISSHGAFD